MTFHPPGDMQELRMQISLSRARRMILATQGLDGRWDLASDRDGTAQIIDRLGYVQIDTISVVERAHDHTLWTRQPGYTSAQLQELLAKDRRVFEYWCPAAVYLPMSDFRFYLPAMQNGGVNSWYRAHKDVIKAVKTRIRAEGPLGSVDFKANARRHTGGWGGWKPEKHALEILFAAGELMVTERRRFQRRYDLTERVLPSSIDTTLPSPDELQRFQVRRALQHAGLATREEIRWGTFKRMQLGDPLDTLVETGEVVPLTVRGVEGGPYYALTGLLDTTAGRASRRKTVHILSPFDNLIIHRGRLLRWFAFPFSLECYLPAAKRTYGYFCLPILIGDRMVGRMDAKADRQKQQLLVKSLILEPGITDFERIIPPLATRLHAFARFNGCTTTRVTRTTPAKIKRELRSALRASA